jgi:hypothetical protein
MPLHLSAMTTPTEYRTYSEQCLQASRVAQVPEVKAALIKMAQRWRDLAERSERQQ